jgi:phosphoglycolate phosphatase
MGNERTEPQQKQKLVVLFGGFGYGYDRPLLYYAWRIARQKGTPTVCIQYSRLHQKEATPQQSAERSLPGALHDAEKQIPGGYAQYILVGKSFGTMVAGAWAKSHPEAACTLLQLTPLPFAYDAIYAGMPAFMATGTADPFSSEAFRSQLVADPAIETLLVPGGNHSLDTPPDYASGLDWMKPILKKYQETF